MNPQPQSSTLTLEHLAALYDITRTINSSLEFDQAITNVIDAIMRLTRAERGVLMGYDADSDQVLVLGARGIHGENLAREEAYSTTIVRQVVQSRETLLTNNALFDDRINPGQSMILRGLRAILCAPMLVQDRLVGVVYVDASLKSSAFTAADRDLLSAVANLAGAALENARLYTVAVEKGRLERELQMAREIQEGLLPKQMPQVEGYEVAAIWQSAREMAGDFYDVFQLDGDTFGVVIADVSDKGAPSALLMAVARSMIRSYAFAGFTPLETIQRTNNLILDDTANGMFVTAFHSRFQRGGIGWHINAGHNPPLLLRAVSGQVEWMPRGGRAIGWFPDNPLGEMQFALKPGDCMVYYTDGLTDAENRVGEPFGAERLAGALAKTVGRTAAQVLDNLLASVSVFADGQPPFDDVTLVVVRYAAS